MQTPFDIGRARHRSRWLIATGLALAISTNGSAWGQAKPNRDSKPGPSGWVTGAPRPEIAPAFDVVDGGGHGGSFQLVIRQGATRGLHGWWTRSFPVEGGTWYRFAAYRNVRWLPDPRRHILVRLRWQDGSGKPVPYERPIVDWFRPSGSSSIAQPEYPPDGTTDAEGWTEVGGTYQAPPKARRVVVELQSRWAPGSTVSWSDIQLNKTAPPAPRTARLATVHYRPRGKSPAENRAEFAPLIAQAAEQKADLVVLPETLTYYGTRKSYAACAEPIPGPSTKYFGALAKKHRLYIVAGLLERDGPRIFNVAVLLGPDGQLVGTYRKICLPRSEASGGICPGDAYPVFETRFGKLAMMVCYDGFFPEVARELSNRGAEVIAFPVWGCNPLLVRARACENHVYIVSSTYTDAKSRWIVSGVFAPSGEVLQHADTWGSVVVTEVDLNRPTYWSSLGDFRNESNRHRP